MTEKRFTLTFDDKIIDNLTGIIHDVHSGYDVAMDLSGLLNVLNDENEQLKQRITTQSVDREQLCKRIDEVRKENEQLKSTIDEMIKIFQDSGLDYVVSEEVEEILNE